MTTTRTAQQKMTEGFAALTDDMLLQVLDGLDKMPGRDTDLARVNGCHEINRRVAARGLEDAFDAVFDDAFRGSYQDAYRQALTATNNRITS